MLKAVPQVPLEEKGQPTDRYLSESYEEAELTSANVEGRPGRREATTGRGGTGDTEVGHSGRR